MIDPSGVCPKGSTSRRLEELLEGVDRIRPAGERRAVRGLQDSALLRRECRQRRLDRRLGLGWSLRRLWSQMFRLRGPRIRNTQHGSDADAFACRDVAHRLGSLGGGNDASVALTQGRLANRLRQFLRPPLRASQQPTVGALVITAGWRRSHEREKRDETRADVERPRHALRRRAHADRV